MAKNAPLTLELDSHPMHLVLFDDAAPRTCEVLRQRLPLQGDIVHAMWSGPLCLLNEQYLDESPLENPVTFLAPGDVIYHPVHHEIGFTYGTTQFREPIGSVYVTLIGRIDDDLSTLERVGKNLQTTGAQPIVLR